ncbi:hypothetical protein QT972_00235 [Microcoleus sp. herbarium7]|uniref:hypothetical protein n=1 Tax=Microcoleus sp. herbarium7 TaxID=3055435 RepID=UPI002FD1C24F
MAELTDTLQPIIPPQVPSKPEVKKNQAKEETSVSAEQPAEFATEYFHTLGLAVCAKCGSKKQTDGAGKITCAIGITIKKECPMLAGKEDK